MNPTPEIAIPHAPLDWDPFGSWQDIAPFPPFVLADGSGPARQHTTLRVCYDTATLYVRFDCDDRDIWGTYTERDDPIYDEEVVEVFLAPGEETPPETPTEYAEIEVSPNGVLFDAWVRNPTGDRAQMVVDTAWDWPGILWRAERVDDEQRWSVVLVLPWVGIARNGPLPPVWRANFYRIERPRDAAPEFSCWSPTLTEPADFHRPGRFGTLRLDPSPYAEQN